MAAAARAHLLTLARRMRPGPADGPAAGRGNRLVPPDHSRTAAISRVLIRVLALNLLLALAKVIFGYVTGAVSILSDGFHSLSDGASNLVALIGVKAAHKPPDADHPYGHRKFETLAAVGIVLFLVLVMLEVLRAAFGRLREGGAPDVTSASFVIMAVAVLINVVVIRYERREADRLGSEVLFADAMHTRSDLLTSLTVVAALIGVQLGMPLLDPLAALVVAAFIGHAGLQVARTASDILADRAAMDEGDVREIVLAVPGVVGCHRIRTRGSAHHVFLDLHVWMAPETRLDEAHRLSHVVKDRLMSRYPQIADAVIHIEPPPREGVGHSA